MDEKDKVYFDYILRELSNLKKELNLLEDTLIEMKGNTMDLMESLIDYRYKDR